MEPIYKAIPAGRGPKRVEMTETECKRMCSMIGVEYLPGYESRALQYTISDETPDRYGDVVRAKGIDLTNYKNNPVIHLAHDTSKFPIANSLKTWYDSQDKSVKAIALFLDDRVDPTGLSDVAFRMASSGFMRGASIGFIPKDSNSPSDPEERESIGLGDHGREFTKAELLEFSACSVPCNPNALTQQSIRSKSIEDIMTMMNKDIPDNAEAKPGYDETENEIRYRVKDPSLFEADSFKRITLQKKKPQVFAVIGKLKGETSTTVQALRFPKSDGWDVVKAKAWVKEHFAGKSMSTEYPNEVTIKRIIEERIMDKSILDLEIEKDEAVKPTIHSKLDAIHGKVEAHKDESAASHKAHVKAHKEHKDLAEGLHGKVDDLAEAHKAHKDLSEAMHGKVEDLAESHKELMESHKELCTKVEDLADSIKDLSEAIHGDDDGDVDGNKTAHMYDDVFSGISSLRTALKPKTKE